MFYLQLKLPKSLLKFYRKCTDGMHYSTWERSKTLWPRRRSKYLRLFKDTWTRLSKNTRAEQDNLWTQFQAKIPFQILKISHLFYAVYCMVEDFKTKYDECKSILNKSSKKFLIWKLTAMKVRP